MERFNWKYYKENSSVSTKRAEQAARNRDKVLTRTLDSSPPLRGFANVYRSRPMTLIRFYDQLISVLLKSIQNLKVSELGKQSLIAWETFQSTQKGPVWPIKANSWKESVTEAFLQPLDKDGVTVSFRSLSNVFNSLFSHFHLDRVNLNANDIDFTTAWSSLPSTTIRGFPYNCKGKDSDEEIINIGGSTFSSALDLFESSPQNICFSGVRLQGTPSTEWAKVRLVSIPPVSYQYVNVGLVYPIMNHLKRFNSFCGWNEPDVRDNMILSALKKARQNECTIISLDFSKFDRCVSFEARKKAHEAIALAYKNSKGIDRWWNHQLKMDSSQFIMLANEQSIVPVQTDGLLLSGVIDTQLSGSLINLGIQSYILQRLKSPILYDSMLALGDDVGIPIKDELLFKWGYKGILSKIKEISLELGFVTHDIKSYPLPQLTFLQRLYLPEEGIIGIGSYARSIASFFWKENFTNAIEGIKSIKALELFSQIVMMSDIERQTIFFSEFRQHFANFWINNDDGLRAIMGRIYDDTVDKHKVADTLVRVVIDLSSTSMETVLTFLKIHAYDRYNLVANIDQTDYSRVFNFSVEIVTAWSRGNWKFKTVRDVFGVEFQLTSLGLS